jgi:Fic family protein
LKSSKAAGICSKPNIRVFPPTRINNSWSWEDGKINTLLAKANSELSALNSFSLHIPDINIYIQMHVAKEATQSSKIEGTRTELEEA